MKMKWFVLFVRTGYEEKTSEYLSKCLDNEKYSVFRPLVQYYFPRAGNVKIEIKAMFQGYVFIETDTDSNEVPIELLEAAKKVTSIYKILYNDYTLAAVADNDRIFLDSLLNEARVLERSIGVIRGDKVIIHQGPMIGKEGLIRKIDRHKRKAFIEASMFNGIITKMEVPLEIISKL